MKLKAGDRVKFGGPNWATGYEFDEDDPGREWTGTVVREDEDAGFESYYVKPDAGAEVLTEDDGTVSVLAIALTLLS